MEHRARQAMLRIRPFRGLRPDASLVAEVACVPYDVVDRSEAAALAREMPNSLLHVDRAEINLPDECDPYSPLVYATACERFKWLQQRGVLIRESGPCVYLYQQRMGTHEQIGVAVVCHIEDYETGVIKRHEKTRPDKEDDRTQLIDALSANTGPVFLTYRGTTEIDGLISQRKSSEPPLFDFTAPDGVQHTVWRVPSAEELVQAFSRVSLAYVADGHHRTASAVRVGRERRAANPAHNGSEDYNWFLAVLFPAAQLRILPYNRVIHDLEDRTPTAFLEEVARHFAIVRGVSPSPRSSGDIRMYLDGEWYGLTWQTSGTACPIGQLDVSVLQERLLGPLLGIDDPRTSKRIQFIGGIRGTSDLEELVDGGRAAVAFSMWPTTVDQLMAIADAGEIMPPKSTWFEPKLRSGLFIHTF